VRTRGVCASARQTRAIAAYSAGLDVAIRREAGDPAEVIAERVRDAEFDLLVMGAYGHSRIRTLIIGSTTTALIRSCKVPVLLFR